MPLAATCMDLEIIILSEVSQMEKYHMTSFICRILKKKRKKYKWTYLQNKDSDLEANLWFSSVQFSSVAQSCPTLCDPMNRSKACLSITNSLSSLKLTSIESVIPSSHLILCRPVLLLPPIPPSIRVFSNESTLHMRWPKYWSFSFSIIPSKTYDYQRRKRGVRTDKLGVWD